MAQVSFFINEGDGNENVKKGDWFKKLKNISVCKCITIFETCFHYPLHDLD